MSESENGEILATRDLALNDLETARAEVTFLTDSHRIELAEKQVALARQRMLVDTACEAVRTLRADSKVNEATLVEELGEAKSTGSDANVIKLRVLRAGMVEQNIIMAELQGELDDRWESYQRLTGECAGEKEKSVDTSAKNVINGLLYSSR